MIRTYDGTTYKRVGGKPGDRTPATGFQRTRALYTAVGGETSITLSSLTPPISYAPGQNQISVKRSSGGPSISGIDFFETTSGTVGIPVSDPLIAGEIVEIIREFAITGIMAVNSRPDAYSVAGTAGQTLVTTNFSFPYNLNSQYGIGGVKVFLHGVLQTRGVDYTEVNLGTANTNQFNFVDTLIGGENIVVVPTYQVIDQSAAASTFLGQQNANLQAMLGSGTQAFIDQSSTISVPNTAIVGRASIPNIANDLRSSMGVERVPVQQIVQIQNEFGPNGEPVWGAVNDDRGLIRFVGQWTTSINSNGASQASGSNITDYVEVTFYGTGLNLVGFTSSASYNALVTVDGGVENTTNVFSTSASSVLSARNYSPNQVFSLPGANGLAQGIHTIKIRNNTVSAGLSVSGFEVLNESAAIKVNSGSAYIGGQKLLASAQQSFAYNVGVTGTRGGRQLVYLKSDGTIGQAFNPVNAASAFLTAVDHTNEEIVRTYFWREFGAGRSDDFSLFSSASPANVAFTLDDGVTTLVGSGVAYYTSSDGVYLYANGSFTTLTFVGTGLDIVHSENSVSVYVYEVFVDGSTVGTFSTVYASSKIQKLVSGLSYGTHTVKIVRNSASTDAPHITAFKVYQPKKPSLPAGAVELADYNVMANYGATAVAGNTGTYSLGVLAKQNIREMTYVGTWAQAAAADPTSYLASGFRISTTVQNSYLQYTFFGTGFEWESFMGSSNTGTSLVQIDGSNAGAAVTVLGGSATYSSGTSTITYVPGAQSKISVSSLSLGLHTVRITKTDAGTNDMINYVFNVITPVHSVKSNTVADLQNTLSVGSLAISDNRKTSMIKEALPAQKAWAQAVGVTSSPATTSTALVPVPDMSIAIRTAGSPIEVFYSGTFLQSSAGSGIILQAFVDGTPVGNIRVGTVSNANYETNMSDKFIVPVSAGVHKVDLYFRATSGTVTAEGVERTLSAREI